MLSQASFTMPFLRINPIEKRMLSAFIVGAATVVVALAAIYAITPIRTMLQQHLHRTALAAVTSSSQKPDNVSLPTEEECVVRAQVVGPIKELQSYAYSGEVRGRYESMLAFQVGGRIAKRNVQLGDCVRAGDVLMEIDPKDVKESVALASAQVRAAESQLRLAEVNLGRFQRLDREGAIAKIKLDQMQTEYDAASSALDQASALFTQTSNQLEYTLLRADHGGIIAGVSAEVGQVVAPGAPVVTLVRDGDREVEITVPENRIDSLRNVKSITVTFWALPGQEFDGEIRETAPMADPILRTYKTRIRLLNAPTEIKLGMTASVRAEDSDDGNAVTRIPLSAIYQDDDKPNVWIVKDGKLALREIQIGGFDSGTVRVLSGLNDGDVVVTAGVHKLTPGQKVRVLTGVNS